MVEEKEGAGRRGGGGSASTTMSIQTSVNFRHFLSSLLLNKSLSNLTILLVGPCHKLKKTVKGSFNKSFSYTVNFNLLCQSRQLTYHDFFNQHTVNCHLFKNSVSLLPRVLQYEAHFPILLVGSQDQCITIIHNGLLNVLSVPLRHYLPIIYVYMIIFLYQIKSSVVDPFIKILSVRYL